MTHLLSLVLHQPSGVYEKQAIFSSMINLYINVYSVYSDALLNAPDDLFIILSLVFKDWMTHGTVTKSTLAYAFIPLVKNSLKDPVLTDSYRAIASSSLILKTFEQCVLHVWGDRRHSDSLQLGFKKKCSTSMTTWRVQEVAKHYLSQGSKPVVIVLDCAKAFDLARFNILFN